ncbi:uncharacterized protein TNCV_755161 [Trichonephila clavipes]|nr:uncharacterized protein TNCV_755161 [Trichonephila clavipes]
MPGIKIVDNGLFEETGRLNVYLNGNKLKQLENQHVEIDERWVEILNRLKKNEHIPYENLVILVEFTSCCPGTNAPVERAFSIGNFWTNEKSRLNVDNFSCGTSCKDEGYFFAPKPPPDVLENNILTNKKIFIQ